MDTLWYAGYARVSLDEQRKGNSLDEQIRRIHQWTRDQSLPFQLAQYQGAEGTLHCAEFQEDYTGFEYERPDMDVLRELARQGTINAVVVLRTDRFSRDEAVFMLLERFFKKHGVRLFSVEEGEFTPGVVNRYVAAFQRARAEDDAETSKKRMREARRAYIKSGIIQGQGHPIYGYYKVGNRRETRYLIHKEQSAVVKFVYYLYVVERLGIVTIAKELNDMEIPTRGIAKRMKHQVVVGKWIAQMVRQILKNSAYKGVYIGNRTQRVEGEDILTSPDEQVIVEILAIVDEKTWEQAQYLLEHNKSLRANRDKQRDYLLSGMLTCLCGRSMAPQAEKPRNKYYYYYRCNAQNIALRRGLCDTGKITAEHLEFTVWDFVERLANDTQTTLALYQQEHEASEATLLETRQRIEAIDELLAENKEETERLNLMYQKKRCEEDYFEAQWERLTQEREALLKERQKSERIFEKKAATGRQFSELEAIGEELRNATEEATFEKKRRTLERLKTHVTVEGKDSNRKRWVVIEVLGYKQRVGVKKPSARACCTTATVCRRFGRLPT